MTTEESSSAGGVDEVDEPAADGLDEADELTPEEEPGRDRRLTRWVGRFGVKATAIVLAALVVATATMAGWVYRFQYRPDQQTVVFTRDLRDNSPAAKAAIGAAANGTVALLSYSPESVDRDFASAKTHLTGEFLTYYSKFTEQIVAPAAKDRGVKTTATVVQAAVSELHPDSAVVLLFVNQTTTSKDRPEPNMAASSVVVRLAKTNDNWLIAKFDPV
jgi:Mce-associated membrane protein